MEKLNIQTSQSGDQSTRRTKVDLDLAKEETERMKLRRGVFDFIFGSNEPKIYIGLVVIVLSFAILGYVSLKGEKWESAEPCWRALGPLISGIVGFIFGYRAREAPRNEA